MPRTADGKPDLSGFWLSRDPSSRFDLSKTLQPGEVIMTTPWAAMIQKQRMDRDHVDDPYGYCMPLGVPRINYADGGFKWLNTPFGAAALYETGVMLTFRQIFADGRPLPEDPQPTWLGYSIGRWERDIFVVETTGFRDRGWLDFHTARPHSDALHVTERFHRTDFGHMDVLVTITDPKAYVKPWTIKIQLMLRPDDDIIEAFCDTHGKTMEQRLIDPPPPEPPSPPLAGSTK
jgi:hypothetical protein